MDNQLTSSSTNTYQITYDTYTGNVYTVITSACDEIAAEFRVRGQNHLPDEDVKSIIKIITI